MAARALALECKAFCRADTLDVCGRPLSKMVDRMPDLLPPTAEAAQARKQIEQISGQASQLIQAGQAGPAKQLICQCYDLCPTALDTSRSVTITVMDMLSLVNRQLGDGAAAIDASMEALALARAIGDKRAESSVLGNLGATACSLGQYAAAIDHLAASQTICQAPGDMPPQQEYALLLPLSEAHANMGNITVAIECMAAALAITRDIGDKNGEAVALGNLASLDLARKGFQNRSRNELVAMGFDDHAAHQALGVVGMTCVQPHLIQAGRLPLR